MKTRLLFLTLLLMAESANASSLPDYPFLFEAGTAQIDVAPDRATVSITIGDRGLDAAKVFSEVNASVATVLDALARAKVPRADIDTSDFQRSVDYAPVGKDKPPPMQTVISRDIKVRLKDLTAWPALMADLGKINNIDNLNSEFQTSARSSIEAELALQAARDAQSKAQRTAASFGRKLGPTMAISRSPFNALERTFTEAGGGYGSAAPYIPPASTAINLQVPATIRLSGSVNVLFKLE